MKSVALTFFAMCLTVAAFAPMDIARMQMGNGPAAASGDPTLQVGYLFATDGTDSSDNGYDATFSNGLAVTSGHIELDGVDDHTETATSDELDALTNATISAFIELDNLTANQYVLSYGESSSINYYLGFYFRQANDRMALNMRGVGPGDDYVVESTFTMTTGITHVAVVMDGTDWIFYIDGVDHGDTVVIDDGGGADQNQCFAYVSAGADRYVVGALARSSIGNEFNGRMDNVKIYNTPMTSNDIVTLSMEAHDL